MLERNELHLTAIKLLAPYLTQANHVEVLERARGKSKREVELLVAEIAPKPDVPSVPQGHLLAAPLRCLLRGIVRKLPAARPSARVVPQPAAELIVRELRLQAAPQLTTPLSPGRYKVQFMPRSKHRRCAAEEIPLGCGDSSAA